MKLLIHSLLALFLIACGDDSSTSAINLNDGDDSSKSSSSSAKFSSSVKVVDPAEVIVGSMTDSRDGQTYKIVKIGTQTWMAENLNYETENSYCNIDDSANCSKYGRLYTWAAAMDSAGSWSVNGKGCGDGSVCTPTGTIRGVCPAGWHLPLLTEWNTLFTAVGGSSTAGKFLKSPLGWKCDDNGSDAFSFSALPSGDGYYKGFFLYGIDGAGFWSSTESRSYDAFGIFMSCYENAYLYYHNKDLGLSVRCLKDDESEQSAKSSSSIALPTSSDKVTELVAVTAGIMTDSRDGQTYKTVKIGSQTWMAQNLNYETANSYCYQDILVYCSNYGRLYSWAAAMDSAGTWSTNGKGCGHNKICSPTFPVRGVCPVGWHLPSQTEWEALFAAVGGQSTAGKVLKSTSGWISSGDGTDAFAFSALPAGYRSSEGHYSFEGDYAYFWSSTEDDSYYVYVVDLNYSYDYAGQNDGYQDNGLSVRCLKD